MRAPAPTVTRKAMISKGTARRSAGSAVSNRRYAGLAIHWAKPLMESARADACAASARAIAASDRCPRVRFDVPHLTESESLESKSRDLSRLGALRIAEECNRA